MVTDSSQLAETSQQQPEQTRLAQYIGTILPIITTVGGATALFGAIASFAGRRYLESYYETIGIPFSVLQFSTQFYIFSTLHTLVFAFVGMTGAMIGLILGYSFRLSAIPELSAMPDFFRNIVDMLIKSEANLRASYFGILLLLIRPFLNEQTWSRIKDQVINRSSRTSRRFWVAYLVATIVYAIAGTVVAIGLLLTLIYSWLAQELGPNVTVAYGFVGLISFLMTFLTTVFYRNRTDGDIRRVWLSVVFTFAIIAVPFTIAWIPSFLGKEFATRHLDDSDHFLTATFVIKGKLGIDGERAISPDGRVESIEHQTCDEFVGGSSNPPSTLCEITDVQIVLRNNGAYFVRDLGADGTVYRIAEDDVIRVAYHQQSTD